MPAQDKKIGKMLRDLSQLKTLSEDQVLQVYELYDAWMSFEFVAFGPKQEQLAYQLFDNCLPNFAEVIINDKRTAYAGIPWVQEIVAETNGKLTGLAKKEMKFHLMSYRVAKRIADRNWQKQVRHELATALEEGRVDNSSIGFCHSLVQWYDERQFWTRDQLRAAENHAGGNQA